MPIVKNNLDSLPFLFLTIATTFPNFWAFLAGKAGAGFGRRTRGSKRKLLAGSTQVNDIQGDLAEWLGSGLQIHLQRFESASRLLKR